MTQKFQLKVFRSSRGQSLIETIVAIFVLTSGLASGLALAIFSFGSSTQITTRIIATDLAREGIEVIRRMRDSNWLEGSKAGELVDCGGGQPCLTDWLNETDVGYHVITPSVGNGTTYRVNFDPISAGDKWSLLPAGDYRLYLQPGGGFSHNGGAGTVTTNFFRKMAVITVTSAAPYNLTSSPLILVRSTVWWWGKNCPQIADLVNPALTACKIIAEENLSNWRNY
jgi:hypothetical protein